MKEIIAALIFVLLIFWGLYIFSVESCHSRAELMGMPAKFSLLTDCMIEYEPNRWISMDKYRALDE